jgi:hypothetical protein
MKKSIAVLVHAGGGGDQGVGGEEAAAAGPPPEGGQRWQWRSTPLDVFSIHPSIHPSAGADNKPVGDETVTPRLRAVFYLFVESVAVYFHVRSIFI